MAASAQETWELGRSEWPDVALPMDAFVRYAEALGLTGNALAARASDLYIVAACLEGVPRSSEGFTRRYLTNVLPYLGSIARGRGDDFLAEVGQRLAEKLLVGIDGEPPRLRKYEGRGPLEGWIRMAAVRCGLDIVRRESPPGPREDAVERAVGAVDGELAFLKERYRAQFSEAFRAALSGLSPEGRALLRLHYVEQVTTAALASIYGVSRPTIVRRLKDAREEVLKAVARHVRKNLKVEVAEYESLLELVRSQMDVSLTGLLRKGEG